MGLRPEPGRPAMSAEISIELDGYTEVLPAGLSIAQLVERFGAQQNDLLVDLNGRFVHPDHYASTKLSDGDRVELILAAFGG